MVRNNLVHILVILAILACCSSQSEAAVIITGTLNGTSSTANRVSDRADGFGGYLDSANDSLPYEIMEIRTTVPGDTLTVTVDGSTQFDSFLALYSTFDPTAPQANILAADDDGNGYPHAKLTKTGLAANTSYYLVITSYSANAAAVYPQYGSYSLTLGGSFTMGLSVTMPTVSASPNPAAYGQNVTLTATVPRATGVAQPTGTVIFRDGTSDLGSVPLDATGQASLIVSGMVAGSHSIAVTYGGDSKYASATSLPVSVTVNPVYTLAVTFAGQGGNKIESTAPDQNISCLKGSSSGCSANYVSGTSVTLQATADWKSLFSGWSGGHSGSSNPGAVTMDSDKTVIGTFDLNYKAKLFQADTPQACIQDACNDAADGETLLAQEYFFQEPSGVTLGLLTAKTITIKGGYQLGTTSYDTVTGMTAVRGPLAIRQGRLNLQRVQVHQ